MEKRWVYNDPPPEQVVEDLSAGINVNPVLASILAQRGINTYEDARNYFRPNLENLLDPFLMKDMDKAVDRLSKAINKREKILIYGDYDVDGTTSVALVYGFLKKYNTNLGYYIPDRYKEGYGVSSRGIEYATENNFSLIVSLDCGIKAVEKVGKAKESGIDFIICDHHLPGKDLPPAIAILDPKQQDCPYPFKELSGCGVGFKLLQAFCQKNDIPLKELYESLDLLAVSIASDIVPIIGENRILAFYGLKKLNSNPSAGLNALIEIAGIKKNVNISGIVFGIGPRINASGRIDHAKTVVKLLTSEDEALAVDLADGINEKNTIRRSYDMNSTTEALKMVDDDPLLRDAKSTVLFNNSWHKGIVGIVAARCVDKYYRPTIILTESNRMATGSARSVDGFNIYKAIEACSDLLEQFGGHRYAAGLTMKLENVEEFKKKFEEIVCESITDDQRVPQVEIDQKVTLDKINKKFFNILRQMAPFGPGNMDPVFVAENLQVSSRPKVIKEEHLKFFVKQSSGVKTFECIGFGFAQYFEMLASGMKFNMAFTIEENNFMGMKSIQLCVKDIKFD